MTDTHSVRSQAPPAPSDTQHPQIASSRTHAPAVVPPQAAASAVVAQFREGDALGKYVVSRLLGKGGMGEVYKAFDPLVERDVAIKVLPASLTRSEQALKRFLAEARALGKLIHPHTVALYEIGQHDGAYFLAMEFVGGGSVGGLLERQRRLDWQQAARFTEQICRGLAAAHAVGLIHRDIKPDNLLCVHAEHCKITDFGLAKINDSEQASTLSLTKPGDLLGTPYYMSPEQFTGAAVDGRCDLYATGGTFYHLLTGQPPYFEAGNLIQVMYGHSQGPVPDPRAIVPELPEICAAIVQRAMAKRPDDRFANAAEMADALAQALQTVRGSGPAVSYRVSGAVPPALVPAETARPAASAPVSAVGLGRSGVAGPGAAAASGSPVPASPVVQGSGGVSAPMAPSSDLSQSQIGRGHCVWLVEPSGLQAKILTRSLQTLGVTTVRTFANIAEVMAELAHSCPTAIFSAMHLEDGTGDDLVRALLSSPMGARVYCFLISSDASQRGPSSFYPGRPLILPKPVTQETLAHALQRVPVS